MKKYNNVAGNFEDKYNAKNPISRLLVSGFLKSYKKALSTVSAFGEPSSMLEIGAAEGHLTKIAIQKFPDAQVVAGDLEEEMNSLARMNLKSFPQAIVQQEDIRKLSFKRDSFDLVVCCEVLEHVPNPSQGVKEIKRVLKPGGYAIVSVPHEPIWRVLNMSRGKYLKNLGNTPGHLNHWGAQQFVQFIRRQGFTIIKRMQPFPWTMLVIQKPVLHA